MQFPERSYFYVISLILWLIGLYVWQRVDRGISREALEAISEDEEAAASLGINVMREKLRVTVVSAALTSVGGSLGFTPRAVGHSWYALQFPEKSYFYIISLILWLIGLYVWRRVDRGISREALEAISEDEDAAAAVGINVLREKLRVTIISAALTALGGAIYGQYFMYLNPDTVSGIAVSLQIVFAVIAGGVYSLLGPTVGSLLTQSLTEALRVWFGTNFIGAANTIYGILLMLFIIFMPRGILGLLPTPSATRSSATAAPAR